MAYEIKTYYLDVSYYLENPTVPNLDSLRRSKINKTIEIFEMTGGNWVTEQQTWYDENGILHEMQVAVGRYATLENFPFIFYVEAGRNSSGYGSDRMSRIAIINPETQAYIDTNFSLFNSYDIEPVPQEYKWYHFSGMVEKIVDIGGGYHFHIIRKKYDNDSTYVYDGNRQYGLSIVPVYDTETHELFDWAIRGQYGWYLSKDMSKSVSLDFTNDGIFFKIFNDGKTSIDYPTLTSTQVIYSTVGAYNKYYTVGFGSVCKGLTLDTGNISHWNNRSNVKDKIVLPKSKDDNDLYFANGFYGVVAYVENEKEETT